MNLSGTTIRTGVAAASAFALAGSPEAQASPSQHVELGNNVPGLEAALPQDFVRFQDCARTAIESVSVDPYSTLVKYGKRDHSGRRVLSQLGVEVDTDLKPLKVAEADGGTGYCEGTRSTKTVISVGKNRKAARQIFELTTRGNSKSTIKNDGIEASVTKICKDSKRVSIFSSTRVKYTVGSFGVSDPESQTASETIVCKAPKPDRHSRSDDGITEIFEGNPESV